MVSSLKMFLGRMRSAVAGARTPQSPAEPMYAAATAVPLSPDDFSLQGGADSEIRELIDKNFKFDITSLLQLRSFLYLLVATGVVLFQTNNTLAIKSLSMQNEKLRDQLLMTASVLTSQELKVHELHSIHNISQTAEGLGLTGSSVPSVKLLP